MLAAIVLMSMNKLIDCSDSKVMANNATNFSPSLMVGFTPINLHRPVNLLHQHEAHELMGQRHAPNGGYEAATAAQCEQA